MFNFVPVCSVHPLALVFRWPGGRLSWNHAYDRRGVGASSLVDLVGLVTSMSDIVILQAPCVNSQRLPSLKLT